MPEGNPCPRKSALFDQLFSENRDALFAFFLGHIGDRDDAKDQTQETFARTWKRIDQLMWMGADRRRFWLFAVARNVLTDFRRRRQVREAAESQLLPTTTAAVDSDLVLTLDRAIAKLPENQRAVLTMTVMGEMSREEIARVLGRPAGTVRSELHEARKSLARLLQ